MKRPTKRSDVTVKPDMTPTSAPEVSGVILDLAAKYDLPVDLVAELGLGLLKRLPGTVQPALPIILKRANAA